MSDVMQRYDELAVLCEQLLSLMARGSECRRTPLPHRSIATRQPTSCITRMSSRPQSLPNGWGRCSFDYGTVTLLRQDDAPGGLEVRGADEEWHQVPAEEGAYVVSGDASNAGRRVVGAPPFTGCRFLHLTAVLTNGSRSRFFIMRIGMRSLRCSTLAGLPMEKLRHRSPQGGISWSGSQHPARK